MKNLNPYCAQIRSQGSRRRICPHRLAVPEKIFALPACSIFSTAAGAPPRFIRHWRRSAPHPLPLPRSGGGAVWANNCLFKFQSRQRDFLRLTPRQIAVLAALRCPKKIFALLACSIFSTATDAPPRCIRHWRCSAPHPHPPRPPHPQICIINPSCNFLAKSDICAIFAQYLPIM